MESFRPQLIGISVRNIDNVNMIHSICYLPEITKIVEQVRRWADVPLVVGGSGASLMPAQVFKLLGADYIVVADGEVSFVRLMEALERGRSPRTFRGWA